MADDIFDQALRDMFGTPLVEDAVFAPKAGDPVPCRVSLEKDVDPQPGGYETTAWAKMATIEAILAEIGKEPDRGETFTVDGTVYRVEAVLENDGRCVKVQVV